MGVPQWLCHVELAFLALFPLFPVMFSSLAKDTISVLFFIPFCILFVDGIRTKGSSLSKPGIIITLLLCGLLTCLTKKAGVYVVVPSLLLMFLIVGLSKKAKATAFAIGAVIAIVMMVIIPKAVMPALGVAPSGKQESIPFAIQREVPNADTIAAMREADDMVNHPEQYETFHSMEDLKRALEA